MEKKESIFSGLNPAPSPAAASCPSLPRQENTARVAGLEASIKAMQAEIAALKRDASRPQPPSQAKKADDDIAQRLARLEKYVTEIGAYITGQQGGPNQGAGGPASKGDLETVKSDISRAYAFFESVKRGLSQYTAEFSNIESECRKSLGEMQGYAKNIDAKLVAERFDDYLKDSVTRMNARLAELEKTMHTGLSDLSSRLMTDEVLYRKIFTDAEERLRKGLEPDLSATKAQLKFLSSKVTWLMEEYTIVMERKMRALEVKYSAFDILSARIDTVNEALKAEKDAPSEK